MKKGLQVGLLTMGALVLWLASCAVGPDYKRPPVHTPETFRTAASDTNAPSTNNLAGLGWWDVFTEPQLAAYLAEASTNNLDIKIAAARILQAEGAARVVRSQFFPSVYAGGDLQTTRTSQNGQIPLPAGAKPQHEFGDLFLSMPSYEIDLWGRIRRANEAARAQVYASVEAQRTVRQTLVAQIATAYYQLLGLDLELEIAERSYVARTNSLDLTRSREQGGVAALQDVHQAQILVYTAEAVIADTHRRVEQQENLLGILLGRHPGDVRRGTPLASQKVRAEVPAGLPSQLLDYRPDIRAAEEQLVSANADIGQAKAAFYPQVSLTGIFGYQTVALSDLFTAPARMWQFGPAVSFPLFTGGRLRGNLKQAEGRFQEAVARYQSTVLTAFREVSDGLVAYKRVREFREKQQLNTEAHRAATELANVRYQGGVASYLEVLYNEQELFTAELNLAQALRDEFLTVVQVYQALGGGAGPPTAPSEGRNKSHQKAK